MAEQATFCLPHKTGRLIRALIEGVENSAELRIRHRHLEHIATTHIAHIHVVIEVDGPWILRCDQPLLQARLGEDQGLTGDGYLEGLKQTREVPCGAFEVPYFIARHESRLKFGNSVHRFGVAIRNRWLFKGIDREPRTTSAANTTDRRQQQHRPPPLPKANKRDQLCECV